MSRLDKSIADAAYILDSLMAYRNIVESGCCNDCRIAKSCEHLPKVGRLVRYNCPFYERKEDNRTSFTFNIPDEVKAAEKFRMDNPEATDAITNTYTVETKKGKN